MAAVTLHGPIVHHGDCLAVLRTLPDESVAAVVTDPPYGLSNTDPKHVAETLIKWVTGDHEYTPSSPRKGRNNCLTEIVRGQEGDAHNTHPETRENLVHRGVTIDRSLAAMLGAVDLDDHASVGEVEVDHVSPALALDDVLVRNTLTRLGQSGEDVELRLWARQGVAGCVGECTCFAELSTSVARVGVRLGYYAARYPESAAPVMALRTTEVRAMLSFDCRRGTVELTPAGPTDEVDLFTLVVTPKSVGTGTGARRAPAVPQTNGVGGVDDAAAGTFSLDLLAHETLLDRCFRPKDTPVGFMGKTWDSFVPPPAVWDECMRVLKPGGHLLVFAGTRTQDLMGLSIRLAGFDIRDGIGWIYGSGFPKSMDVSKAIDKAGGVSPEVQARVLREARVRSGLSRDQVAEAVGCTPSSVRDWEEGRARAVGREVEYITPSPEYREALAELLGYTSDERRITGATQDRRGDGSVVGLGHSGVEYATAPATPEAERWAGWGTALKPAIEPVIVARKPIKGTVAANVLAHGTGGVNVDACRTPTTDKLSGGHASGGQQMGQGWHRPWMDDPEKVAENAARSRASVARSEELGRWPANVLLDPDAAAAMDEQSGVTRSSPSPRRNTAEAHNATASMGKSSGDWVTKGHNDSGGASRFFPVFKYQAKAPAKERPQYTAEDGRVVKHATVKPLELMRWLVRLVTPAGGVVLDPFAGSGTTGEAAMLEGFDSILIEGEAEYLPLIDVRIARVRHRALLEALREADSRSSLEQIFYQDASSGSPVWSDDCTAASKERLKDLARKDA